VPNESVVHRHLARQVEHWINASRRLGRLENFASPEAWGRLERYLGVSLRDHLRGVVSRLAIRGDALQAMLRSAQSDADFDAVRQQLLAFRRHYLRAETTIDFYTDAINTRTNAAQGAMLRACDTLAYRSMASILEPLGHQTPIALTYLRPGLGAAILKANLRLWDGGALSPVAAIKIVQHNLERPTALVHEAGHQIAHIVDWNRELAAALEKGLTSAASPVASMWGGWASEIAADAVAFALTGYGSVVALHDVVASEPRFVFQVVPGDPHPMSFLRVLLGVHMCRLAWGAGPWDALATAWQACYPAARAPEGIRSIVTASLPVLPEIARLAIATPMRAFKGRSLVDIASPDRVSPQALLDLELRLGPALYSSSHWIWTECLRLLALSALHAAESPASSGARAEQRPENWMLRLGGAAQAA